MTSGSNSMIRLGLRQSRRASTQANRNCNRRRQPPAWPGVMWDPYSMGHRPAIAASTSITLRPETPGKAGGWQPMSSKKLSRLGNKAKCSLRNGG